MAEPQKQVPIIESRSPRRMEKLSRRIKKMIRLAPRGKRSSTSDLYIQQNSPTESPDFYAYKNRARPRFIYRRLYRSLDMASDAERRRAALDAFLQEIEVQGSKGEFLKFKWCLPDFLSRRLGDEEKKVLTLSLRQRGKKRNKRLAKVYPACADEFSLQPGFLESIFEVPSLPVISKSTRVFTIGSCFARNIADFLQLQGFNAHAFKLAEDLNSPLSNAKMLSVATASDGEKRAYLEKWVAALYPAENQQGFKQTMEKAIRRLGQLTDAIRCAEVIILTVGNTLDFFIEEDPSSISPHIPVAPKFLGVRDKKDVDARSLLVTRLKSLGAQFRLASFREAKDAISTLCGAVRRANPLAICIVTLSPVPIDNALGVSCRLPYGAIELDCISKSTLRAALFELFNEWAAEDMPIRYFPSYELVRWVGAMLHGPAFGAQDASSRHVSAEILSAVYSFFLKKFGVAELSPSSTTWSGLSRAGTQPSELRSPDTGANGNAPPVAA